MSGGIESRVYLSEWYPGGHRSKMQSYACMSAMYAVAASVSPRGIPEASTARGGKHGFRAPKYTR